MEGFVHIRVDDRLIHGQVATRWATGLKVNRIMIIDDAVAVNETEKSILRKMCIRDRYWSFSSQDYQQFHLMQIKFS